MGAIYAMVALGFTVFYNATGIINFAQGEFVMLGALVAVGFRSNLGFPMGLALALSILVVTAIGLLMYKILILPLKSRDVLVIILMTLSASYMFRGSAVVLWGKDPLPLASPWGSKSIVLLGASILPQAVWILVVVFVGVLLLSLFFERNFYGKALRASAENREAATLVGINVEMMVLLSFGLAAALGAIGGILVAPITSMDAEAGIGLAIKGMVAAILGGLDRISGAVVGAITLGLLEAYSAVFVSSLIKDGIALFILLAVLLVRPSGLLGKQASR